jgi:hypothetical protein
LLLCCLDLYFVSASLYVRTERPADLDELAQAITRASDELDRKLHPPVKPSTAADEHARDVARTRKELGLPPATVPVEPKGESYEDALKRVTKSVSGASRLSSETLKLAFDSTKTPSQIVRALAAREKEIENRPVTVWGVTTPVVVPMTYGGATYQLSATFVASSLLLALTPLVIGWLTALYITRQRELLVLAQLRDFSLAFPHVLNILPVDWSNASPLLQELSRRKRNRNSAVNLGIARSWSSTFRCLVILFFAAPMGGILVYCSYGLLLSGSEEYLPLTDIFLVLLLGGWLAMQTSLLVFQEWHLLWGKEYYV